MPVRAEALLRRRDMPDTQAVNTGFTGTVLENYERYLGPLMFKPYAQDLACRLLVGDQAQVLELACGTGILTSELLSMMASGVYLVASDLNEPMLAAAQQKIRNRRIEWHQADASSLPFDAGRFDAVVSQFGVQSFPDKVVAAAEVRRVLRPGGVFLFSTWAGPHSKPPRRAFPAIPRRSITRRGATATPARSKAISARPASATSASNRFPSSAGHPPLTTRPWASCRARR
jgi:ubiquinone/menaquinone biosynthesis C-methylase UbiE